MSVTMALAAPAEEDIAATVCPKMRSQGFPGSHMAFSACWAWRCFGLGRRTCYALFVSPMPTSLRRKKKDGVSTFRPQNLDLQVGEGRGRGREGMIE